MVPVLDRPVMEYAVGLLRDHGISEIGVTLQYLPEAIMDYFGDGTRWGVKLHYFIETEPLGTAGSVKNCGQFLDQPFVVISGDALTDLALTQVIAFHEERMSQATLVLKSEPCPLEYGVVMTDPYGKVTRFLEKPGWGEVFSDTVNTGIYVLDPVVLDLVPSNRMFDFSKDLFPQLLAKGVPMYGHVMDGYWCDIGNHEQYRQAQEDFLAGRVKLAVPAEEIRPGVFVSPLAQIHPEAQLQGPVFIGEEVRLEPGVKIGPGTVIGRGSQVAKGASVKRSVLWERVELGCFSQIRGAVLGNGAWLGNNVDVFEGAVIGERVRLGDRGHIRPGIKVWPQKDLEDGTTLTTSLIWGAKASRSLFGPAGVNGEINRELTPEFLTRLGAAFASCLPVGGQVALATDGHPATGAVKQSLSAGLGSAGIHPLNYGVLPAGALRYGIRRHQARGGLLIRTASHSSDRLTIEFFDHEGLHIPRGFERKVEGTFAREDVRRVKWPELGRETTGGDGLNPYLSWLVQGTQEALVNLTHRDPGWPGDWQKPQPLVVLGMAGKLPVNPAKILLERFGLRVQELAVKAPTGVWQQDQEAWRGALTSQVGEHRADFGVLVDGTGEHLVLADSQGQIVEGDRLLAFLLALLFQFQLAVTVPVPINTSEMLEALATRYGGRVFRTGTGLRARTERVEGSELARFFQVDALAALTLVAFAAVQWTESLDGLLNDIPVPYLHRRRVAVPWEARGKVMRGLMAGSDPDRLELVDGVKLRHEEGWVLVLPDGREPVCRVYGEAVTLEVAESLTEFYDQRVKRLAGVTETNLGEKSRSF